MSTSGRRRITGCLSRADADHLWHELARTCVTLGIPYRVGRAKYGTGYALYLADAPDIEAKREANPELLFALAAAVGQRDRLRKA
jgi:hypothetical protein